MLYYAALPTDERKGSAFPSNSFQFYEAMPQTGGVATKESGQFAGKAQPFHSSAGIARNPNFIFQKLSGEIQNIGQQNCIEERGAIPRLPTQQ